jgi:hypothetical protein
MSGSAALIEDNVVLVIADAAQIAEAFAPPQWTIVNSSGQIVIAVDSVIDFSFEQDYEISDYPIEGGNFLSYNKVFEPFRIKMTLAIGGTNPINNAISALASGNVLGAANALTGNAVSAVTSGSLSGAAAALTGVPARTAFLQQIEQAQQSLELLTVNTPEISYPSVNVTHVDYDRNAAKGVTLLQVEVWFEQVNVTATATTSNTQQPQSADPVMTGPANATNPTVPQSAVITSTPLR